MALHLQIAGDVRSHTLDAVRRSATSVEPLGAAEVLTSTSSSVALRAGKARIEVVALAPDLFRVGLFGDGYPPRYASEAVCKDEWPAVESDVLLNENSVCIHPRGGGAAIIQLDPLRIGFEHANGQPFARDDPELGMGFGPPRVRVPTLPVQGGASAAVYKQHVTGTHYFACGERTGGLDKTGSHQVFWNIDPPAGHTAAMNNLYTSVPLVLALEQQAWGLFVDSSYRIEFDLALQRADRCEFSVDGGPLIYYVLCGPSPRDVLERYTELTGRIPMPPRWALGNHYSRWGNDTANKLLTVARTFRARGIPLDVIYLDIDYMRDYRVFTWHPEHFPDPAGLVSALAELGVKLVTIMDPGVKVDEDYPVYASGRAQNVFCKAIDGEEYHNVVWPGICAFPDFANPRVRTWWGELLQTLLDTGVAGIWCDMNEPAVFIPNRATFPPDVTHQGDGEARLHVQVHNLYGQLMARATHEGLSRLRPDRRPFVISRAGFAGLQRYAVHWTGDNSSWWEHLRMSMPQLQNLGLSGYAWVGVDVGGFADDANGELLARWTEFGIFQPFCRNHSAWDTRPQEPWAFGEPYESVIREMLSLRQRFVPYLYTLFEEAHRCGAPILRPLLFEWPDDETTYSVDDEFLVGPSVLVAPIDRPRVEHRHVYVPRGTWVHHRTGSVLRGPTHVLAHAPLGEPAFYVRANTPVPLWPALTRDGERAPDPLTWLIYVVPAADEGTGELYEDAGEGFGYQRGEFARTTVRCATSQDEIDIQCAREGAFESLSRTVELDVHAMAQVTDVVVDGRSYADWNQTDAGVRVRLPNSAAARSIRLSVGR